MAKLLPKLLKIKIEMEAVIDQDGNIVGGSTRAKSCRKGPTLSSSVMKTQGVREMLFRDLFNLDRMKPGTRREVV